MHSPEHFKTIDIESTLKKMRVISFWHALQFWFKLGFLSFGGPAGQIALMHRELVEQKRWVSQKRFLHALNYCMVLPGPEAQQLATYLGWLMHRTWGGVLAGVLFVLPSFVLMGLLSWAYVTFGQTTWMVGLFAGIKPAVAALVLLAVHRMASRTLKKPVWIWMAVAAFVASAGFDVPFPVIVLMAALIGWFGAKWFPEAFEISPARDVGSKPHARAIIDDDTPIPGHAHFKWSRMAMVLLAGAVLWCAPMFALFSVYGESHIYSQMAWFFTKAALLTFGGAYAVLPYVYQGAVVQYSWLSAGQMMDGLSLGETTPGPLIMIVAFVAFLGGYQGLGLSVSAGIMAASLVTWFTFLPSFVFILAGAPFVESTRKRLAFHAPLAAIGAVVVGVIAQLALFFVYHVVLPHGYVPPDIYVDVFGLSVLFCAFVAMYRFNQNVIRVIVMCAVVGLLHSFL